MNIRELIESRAKSNPGKNFFHFKDQILSYKAFDETVNMAANGFLRLGVQKHDHFAIMLRNCPQYIYAWFGLNKIGAVQVSVNARLKDAELEYVLIHSESKGVVVNADLLPILQEILPKLTDLQYVIVVGEQEFAGNDAICYQDFIADVPKELAPCSISDDDPAVIIYTSGTTGNPKAVLLSHRGLVLTGESTTYMTGASADDRIITPNPLFHVMAQCYAVVNSLTANASLIILEKFSRSKILEQIRQYNATILVLAAAATPMMWSRTAQSDDGDNPLRLMQSGGVPSPIYHEFEKRFNLKIQTAYSLTEATVALMAPREGIQPRKRTPGVGILMEHPDPDFRNEVKIIDQNGVEVPKEKHGQIIIKNPAVMLGYFKDSIKTAETKRQGWIYTGDIGYQDKDGYFFFVGRGKDVLRRRGELISPAQIESIINMLPQIEDSAIIGVSSELGTGEQEIKAYVQAKPGENIDPREIIEWCSKSLADFKVPRYIEFRDKFSRTPTKKIKKELLKIEKSDLAEGCYDREKDTSY